MSRRNRPLEVVGAVGILAPTGKSPYFRLSWTEPDGEPGRTTAGKGIGFARTKATEIDERLNRAASGAAEAFLDDIITEYTSTHIDRRQGPDGGDWTESYLAQVAKGLARATDGLTEGVQAWDIDRATLDRMRAQAGTGRTVRENTSFLRGLMRWGHKEQYFSAAQAELLPVRCPSVKPSRKGTTAPKRRRKDRKVGETVEYIRNEDAPLARQVVRLGEELAVAFPLWGRLAPELAANTGLRWGEQFQLTAYDCYLDDADYKRMGYKRPYISVDAQIDPSARVKDGGDRRKLPKGEKTRVVGIAKISFTEYRLMEALKARRAAALEEQRQGLNPEALMFPTRKFKMFHHTSWNTDYLVPAALRCTDDEWPTRTWTETCDRKDQSTGKYVRVTRERIQLILTWHSLRHRFARIAVDVLKMTPALLMAIGGWENETVVKNRYYKSGKEHADAGLETFDLMNG